MSGDYLIEKTTVDGCDSLVSIMLDFTTNVEIVDQRIGYFAPTLLRQGQSSFSYRQATSGAGALKSIDIYTIDGRKVFTVTGGGQYWQPGGRDASVPAGVYLYRASFTDRRQVSTGRIVVVR